MNDKTAGGSAQAEYERRAAHHAADVRRRRPRILAVGAIFAVVGLLVLMVNPLWGGVVLLFDVVVVASALFATPNSITAWQTGAQGELRTARLLEPLEGEGFRILHDRQIPGSRANIDHIVIGPPGIYVVETKSLGGSLQIRDNDVFVAGRRRTKMIDEVKREALAVQIALAKEIAARGWMVTPVICVHRADLPWLRSEVAGVRIVSGKDLVKRLREADHLLAPADVERLAALAAARLRPAFVAPRTPDD
ncbi:MAG TPA: nuclease-related domain-containing protein [Terriglobales bacterium]|nr:nuclease-related domain-containing protein [Terriglobales bacterium]